MAYSKVSNKNQDKDVKYLNKDYNSYKSSLLDFAEVYFLIILMILVKVTLE